MMKFNCELCGCRKPKVEKKQIICNECFRTNTGGGSNYPWLKFENKREPSPTIQDIVDYIEIEEQVTESKASSWLKIVSG